jgi:hypothetical protein
MKKINYIYLGLISLLLTVFNGGSSGGLPLLLGEFIGIFAFLYLALKIALKVREKRT